MIPVRSRSGWTAKLAARAAACLLVAGALAGCTSARTNLGTSDSACYLALPAASRAVGGHAKLVGVHLVTLKSLKRMAPAVFKELGADQSSSQRICVVAYSGTFTSQSVDKPRGRSSGPLAVAVLDNPSNRLIGTVILHRSERPFGSGRTVSFRSPGPDPTGSAGRRTHLV